MPARRRQPPRSGGNGKGQRGKNQYTARNIDFDALLRAVCSDYLREAGRDFTLRGFLGSLDEMEMRLYAKMGGRPFPLPAHTPSRQTRRYLCEAWGESPFQALTRAIRDGLRAHLGNKRRLIGKKRRRIFRFDKPTGRYVLLPALLNTGTRADWPDAGPRREYLESVLRSLQIVPDEQRNGNGKVSKDLDDLIQEVQESARFGLDEDMNAPAI